MLLIYTKSPVREAERKYQSEAFCFVNEKRTKTLIEFCLAPLKIPRKEDFSMKILVTGFGSFLGHEVNPAEKVALALKNEHYATVILPVSYAQAQSAFNKIPNLRSYDFILSLGLASGRKYISLEQMAYNEMNAIHLDNDGVRKMGEAIIAGQKPSLKTSVDVLKIHDALLQAGIPSDISDDPGRYICNEVYYLDLSSGIPALFVHFPAIETMSVEKDYEAIQVILATIKSSK
jgi:pyroglutamyl-peptidase